MMSCIDVTLERFIAFRPRKGHAMIYGYILSMEQCRISDSLKYALEFLRDRADDLPDGRHDLVDGMYAEIKKYAPAPAGKRSFESHVRYIDVQCVLDGEEEILVRPKAGLSIKEDLLNEKDIVFYHDPAETGNQYSFVMRPGTFLLLLPEDAHKTECVTTVSAGRKVILKIPEPLCSHTR